MYEILIPNNNPIIQSAENNKYLLFIVEKKSLNINFLYNCNAPPFSIKHCVAEMKAFCAFGHNTPKILGVLEYYTPKHRQIQANSYIFSIFVYYAYFYVNIVM